MPHPRHARGPGALPSHQPRSARTQERILAAVEALLAEGDLEQLTLEQIAERAHVSIGAFYKRFRGKTSLLPLVMDRVLLQQQQRIDAFLARGDWAGVGLCGRIDALLTEFADSQQRRHRLIRALVVGHWQSEQRSDAEARSGELLAAAHRWLSECSEEIRHPDPRLALSLGLFTSLHSLQTAILFERIPPQLGLDRFTAEIARVFKRYVGVERADP